ncbi:unnamed protein product [Ambrosiozyma monospora]|uniref:Unnamed protein product n=1 Tax=Ambrosiozyma monospora TaxID=43982 RepID=A0ACB5TCN0_AMBMO|nr:unnamed protein product [Ambrosiozyma monospora]
MSKDKKDGHSKRRVTRSSTSTDPLEYKSQSNSYDYQQIPQDQQQFGRLPPSASSQQYTSYGIPSNVYNSYQQMRPTLIQSTTSSGTVPGTSMVATSQQQQQQQQLYSNYLGTTQSTTRYPTYNSSVSSTGTSSSVLSLSPELFHSPYLSAQTIPSPPNLRSGGNVGGGSSGGSAPLTNRGSLSSTSSSSSPSHSSNSYLEIQPSLSINNNNNVSMSNTPNGSVPSTPTLVRLARRKKDVEKETSRRKKRPTRSAPMRIQGRPLTPKTRIRLTLVPNLVSLHSVLVSDSAKKPLCILKKGGISNELISQELYTDPKFSANPASLSFPGKCQTAIFVEPNYLETNSVEPNTQPQRFPNAVGLENEVPVYSNIDLAIKEIFQLQEYSLLRITYR